VSTTRGTTSPERAANLLGALAIAVVDRLAAKATPTAGSLTRSAALVLIDDVPRCSIEWLARHLELSHSATVRLVDRLSADDLVSRGPGPDARTVALELTTQGTRAVTEVRRQRADALEALLAPLGNNQRRAFVAIAETLLHEVVEAPQNAWRVCRLCDPGVCVDPRCPVLDAFGELSSPEAAD